MATAIFHPQAWVNDYAIEVDAEGETEFDVGDVPDNIEDDTYESDALREHENAPRWVKDWSGPFYIEIRREQLNSVAEWSGSPDPADPDNFWIDDATGERKPA